MIVMRWKWRMMAVIKRDRLWSRHDIVFVMCCCIYDVCGEMLVLGLCVERVVRFLVSNNFVYFCSFVWM